MKPSQCICLLFLAIILVASSAAAVTVPPEETTREKAARAAPAPAVVQPDEAFLARLCAQQRGPPLPWCEQLYSRRRHHLPMPPPGGDGEEIDPLYGVSKRLVPSGPDRLHN